MANLPKLKRDKYRKRRGGTSEFLDVSCAQCGTHVLLYQKDGPGNLLRLYLDRIHEPPELAALQEKGSVGEVPALRCPKCDAHLATPMVYAPEDRLALRLVPGSIHKSKRK